MRKSKNLHLGFSKDEAAVLNEICKRIGLDPDGRGAYIKAIRFSMQYTHAAFEPQEKKEMEKITHVFYGFHAADLIDGLDGEVNVDEAPTAAKYADMVRAALEAECPDADVIVEYDTGAGGVLPHHLITKVNEWEGHDEVPFVYDTADKVYQTFEWIVKQ